MLCQMGELEMRWRGRREWCVLSGGRARDEMEREEGVVCYVRWESLR